MEESQNPPPQPPVENPAIVKNEQKPSNFKSKLPFLIIAVLLVLVGIFGGYFVLNQTKKSETPTPTPTPDLGVACTQEAKICPDGSAVGREGPNCEFAACPAATPSAETADWKLYTNSEKGFSIKYPSDEYIRLGCPDEGLVLQKRTPQNESQDEKPLETCGRDGRFTIEVQSDTKVYDEPTSSKDFTVTKETVNIGSDVGYKYITKATPECFGMCPEFGYEIRLIKNSKYYLFYIDNIENEPTLEKMLTTFKL